MLSGDGLADRSDSAHPRCPVPATPNLVGIEHLIDIVTVRESYLEATGNMLCW